MTNHSRSVADISIVGLGMIPVRHLTREVDAALRRCKEILYLDPGFGLREYLESLGPKVTALFGLGYRENERRIDGYDRMSAHVIAAALDHPPVTFATYGHPKVYVYPTVQIREAAKLLDLRVEILPGVSSLDCMLIDVGLDPGLDGLQMYEATELLIRDRPLQPDVPCFIWQTGPIETSLYTTRPSVPERFERLRAHLLKFYPASHECKIVATSTFPLLDSEITISTIEELPNKLAHASPVATLYIPPAASRAIANRELTEALESVNHLHRITA